MEKEVGYADLVKALDTSIEVWTYLFKHPELSEKYYLPQELFSKIFKEICYYPLCTLFIDDECSGCPLHFNIPKKAICNTNYIKWADSSSEKDRKKGAEGILKILKKARKNI